ncbi:MAG: DNA-binding protein [Actinomycetota bacterium]
MAQLIVRNLDDDLVQRLKRRAAANGRSAEEEHRQLLRQTLRPGGLGAALAAMPAVGDDDDFARVLDDPRIVDLEH